MFAQQRAAPWPTSPGYAGWGPVYVLGMANIPFVSAPTGSMANNGAVTLGTSLARTYPACYLYLPAGAISTGSAAGWYYAAMSSGTAGTVYNNVYTSGQPRVPASPTPFVTTGPGAFTGDTTEEFGPSFTIPAGAMGAYGMLMAYLTQGNNSTAGAKTARLRFGGTSGTAHVTNASTTATASTDTCRIVNAGLTNSQIGHAYYVNSSSAADSTATTTSSVDTTAAVDVVLSIQKATATDWAVIGVVCLELMYGS